MTQVITVVVKGLVTLGAIMHLYLLARMEPVNMLQQVAVVREKYPATLAWVRMFARVYHQMSPDSPSAGEFLEANRTVILAIYNMNRIQVEEQRRNVLLAQRALERFPWLSFYSPLLLLV